MSAMTPLTFETTGDLLLLIERQGSPPPIGLSHLIWILFSKQVLSTHVPALLKTAKKEFLPLCVKVRSSRCRSP